MGYSYLSKLLLFFFFTLLILYFQDCHSATMVVVHYGITELRNPIVQIGDSVVFQQNDDNKLYIFKTKKAFSSCNFTQATLLTKPNSSAYIWYPSRTGYFYFSLNNGSSKPCEQGQKFAFKVLLSAQPPENQDASPSQSPATTAPTQVSGGDGGVVSSSPAFPWPFRPRESNSNNNNNAPSPGPSLMFSATSPMVSGKNGFPFINSNPVVPLPKSNGEADSATIGSFPISGGHQENGILAVQKAMFCATLLLLLLLLLL